MKFIAGIIGVLALYLSHEYLSKGPLERKIPSEVMVNWKQAYSKIEAYYKNEKDELASNIEDVIRINKHLNELLAKNACVYNYDKKTYFNSELHAEAEKLIGKYKAYSRVFKVWGCPESSLPTDKQEILNQIEKSTNILAESLGPKCAKSIETFSECRSYKDDKKNKQPIECGLRINLMDSGIYKFLVKDDASYSKVQINSIRDLSDVDLEVTNYDNLFKEFGEMKYYICLAGWYAGERTKIPKPIYERDTPSGDPLFGRYDIAFYEYVDGLRNNCLKSVNSTVQSNFENLSAFFGTKDFPMSFWTKNFRQKMQACMTGTQKVCVNVGSFKDKYYISYITKEHKVREVTADDVDADIQRFKSQGMTEAETFDHAYMKDIIQVCEDLEKSGFYWAYEIPNLKKRLNKK